MPQRTNEFQELVDIIHRFFAPQGAKVTPSAMVTGNPGDDPREVDVLVEYETDLYPVRIAVEARDHTRAIDVTQVEQYIGKYRSNGGIVVDKVIIVARAFTKGAVKRAQLLGFELHTLNTLPEAKIGQFSKRSDDEGSWWIQEGEPTSGSRVELLLIAKNGKLLPQTYLRGMIVSRSSNMPLGNPADWAERLLSNGVGQLADNKYKEYAGETLHLLAELQLPDHLIHASGLPSIRLQKMVFDFGKKMRIPDLQAQVMKLDMGRDKSKRIVHETGQGRSSKVSITYEDAETLPRIQVEGTANTVTTMVVQLAG